MFVIDSICSFDSRKDGTSRRLPSPPVGGSINIGNCKMFDAHIVRIISRPLFFCGSYFRRVLVVYEGGLCGERNIRFASKEAAENCRIGDQIIL